MVSELLCGRPRYDFWLVVRDPRVYQRNQRIVPEINRNFTDEAVHIVAYSPTSWAKGLELGWYVGWGQGTGTYVASPHVYGSFNGPTEVDGPGFGVDTQYHYTTWTDSSDVGHFRVMSSPSSTFWSYTYDYSGTPGGNAIAAGETSSNTLPMGPSTLSALQQETGSGSWGTWPGMSACADPPYEVTFYDNSTVSNQ